MTPDDLQTCAQLIFGEEWQRALARALGPLHPDGARDMIDDALVRKWSRGNKAIPAWVAPAIRSLLLEAADALRDKEPVMRAWADRLAA